MAQYFWGSPIRFTRALFRSKVDGFPHDNLRKVRARLDSEPWKQGGRCWRTTPWRSGTHFCRRTKRTVCTHPLGPLGSNFSQHGPTTRPSVERTAEKAFCFRIAFSSPQSTHLRDNPPLECASLLRVAGSLCLYQRRGSDSIDNPPPLPAEEGSVRALQAMISAELKTVTKPAEEADVARLIARIKAEGVCRNHTGRSISHRSLCWKLQQQPQRDLGGTSYALFSICPTSFRTCVKFTVQPDVLASLRLHNALQYRSKNSILVAPKEHVGLD